MQCHCLWRSCEWSCSTFGDAQVPSRSSLVQFKFYLSSPSPRAHAACIVTLNSLTFISFLDSCEQPAEVIPYPLKSPHFACASTSSFTLIALVSGDVISLEPSLVASSPLSDKALFHNIFRLNGESESVWMERLFTHIRGICNQRIKYPGYNTSSTVTPQDREESLRRYLMRLLDTPPSSASDFLTVI